MRAGGNVHVPCLPGAHLCGGGRGLPAPRAADPPSLLPARALPLGSQGARGQVTREAGDRETQASQGSQPELWRSGAGPHPPSPLLLPSTNACVHFLCPAVCQEAGADSQQSPCFHGASSIIGERKQTSACTSHGAALSRSGMSDSLRPHGLEPTRLLCPWGSPSENTRVGCHALLQGIFPTQGSNPGLPHCRWILHRLSHQGSPRILKRVAYPFCRESFQLRTRTRVSGIAGGFFTS